jgi:TonB family protein
MKKYAFSLTSAFTSSSILKARIMMLYKRPSAKVAFSKYMLILPVLAFCFLVTSFIQRKDLPTITEGQYSFLKRTSVKANGKIELKYIFVKKNEYLFRFVDTKTRETVETPKNFKVFLEKEGVRNQEVTLTKMLDGFYYAPEMTGMHTIVFENTNASDTDCLIYFKNRATLPTTEESGVFQNPEILPTLPMLVQITEKSEYPQEAWEKEVEGNVIISTIVNVDGSLSDTKITQSLGYGCDELALQKVRALKNIVAGKHKGKAVRTQSKVQINFKKYPNYIEKAEMPTTVLHTLPLNKKEFTMTLEKGKKYVFTLDGLEGLTKEDFDKISIVILDKSKFFYIAQNRDNGKFNHTIIYKHSETTEVLIQFGETEKLTAGKLVIGTK